MPQTKRASFRLSEMHRAMIEEIAEHQGGLTQTRVVEWAIERLHADLRKVPKKSRKSPVLS